jgi:hypothetical protein
VVSDSSDVKVLGDIAFEVGVMEHGVFISFRDKKSRILRKEVITLLSGTFWIKERSMSEAEYTDEEFEKAEKALEDAKILDRQRGRAQTIGSLLYYGCYHSAKAVL